jgi:tripartite-type tricarboxylate transporter receptor subunit TctC
MKMKISLIAVAIAAVTACTAYAQTAANWPSKPIRMIVPFPAGGTSDILTRLVGQKLTEAWGQQIISDPRPGANGNIGVELTVRAPPDGYTMALMDVGNLSISPSVYTKLPFDIIRDLATVTTVAQSPHVVAVHPNVPVKNIKELVALAKANPGKLNFPTGLGSAPHMAGLSFQQRAGVDWVYIPTRGGASSILPVATGEGDLLFMGIIQTTAHVKSGKLKAIAVSSAKRDPALPDVPAIAETAGYEDFVSGSWQGIVAPAKMPPDIINKMYLEVKRVIALPDLREKLAAQGATPYAMTPAEMSKWLASERDRWIKVVKASGFKMD